VGDDEAAAAEACVSVKQLARYELLEQLGEGGMGAVWLARLSGSHGFEKMCIVKTVLPAIAKDADFVSRFLHEGRVLTQLVHGNIAQVLDMNEAEGQLFLALEYVAGVDLSRLHENVHAANEYMPTALVVALVAQAAEGLGAAHRKQALDGSPLHVVHRDVSPQNIMVSYEGEVKVIDFGIAKSEARSRHTAQASVLGKLGYMSPEQALGEDVDHRADQYALAIVLWELLTNQPFVRRGTLTEMVVAMATPTPKPLSAVRADLPPSLEAVVLKALSADQSARYPDTDAFARALTGELLALGPPPTKPQLGEYVKHRCAKEFNAQRQLLTRVSTQRGGVTPRPASSDPLEATSLRPGPLIPTTEHEAFASTQQVPPRADTSQLTVPGRPSAVMGSSAMTRGSKVPHVAPTSAADATAALTSSPAPAPGEAPETSSPVRVPREAVPETTSPVRMSGEAVPDATSSVRVSNEVAPTSSLSFGGEVAPTAAMTSPVRVPGEVAPTDVMTSPVRVPGEVAPTSGMTSPLPAPAVGAGSGTPSAPLTAGELAAVAPPRSRTLLLLVGGLAIVAVVALTVAFSVSSSTATPDAGLAATVVPDAGLAATDAASDASAAAAALPDAAVAVPLVEEPDAGLAPALVEPQPTLRLTVRNTGVSWILSNLNRTTWTDCSLTAPGRRRGKLGKIAAGASVEVPAASLRVDPLAPLLVGQLRVDCAQGFGFAKAR
jgi:serine/threonine-protein kinase